MSKILLSGHLGFIGSHVLESLLDGGHEVMGLDNGSSGKPENVAHINGDKYRVVEPGNILDPHVIEIATGFRPEIIVHLAAQPSLLESEKEPLHDAYTNIIGTLNLIRLAEHVGAKRFIFSSTSAVESDWSPSFSDTEQSIPTSCYGISKLCAEMYLQHLGSQVIILRFANVFGPRQVPLGENQLVPRVLNHIYNDAFFEVHGEGKPTRDFIYVKDVASAVIYAAMRRYDRGGVFNISSGESHSVNEVLKILAKLTHFKKKWVHKKDYYMQRMHVDMDNNLFVNEFGWTPQYTLEEGLKETVEWYKR